MKAPLFLCAFLSLSLLVFPVASAAAQVDVRFTDSSKTTSLNENFTLKAGGAMAAIGSGFRATSSSNYLYSHSANFLSETVQLSLYLTDDTTTTRTALFVRVDETTNLGIMGYLQVENSNTVRLSMFYGADITETLLENGSRFYDQNYTLAAPLPEGPGNPLIFSISQTAGDQPTFKLDLMSEGKGVLVSSGWIDLAGAASLAVAEQFSYAGGIGFGGRARATPYPVIQGFSTAIPEPGSTVLLLSSAFIGGLLLRRAKRM